MSLLGMLRTTGAVPLSSTDASEYRSFEDIRNTADRPVVVFPECTTSNGRGLLRFAVMFPRLSLPVKDFNIYVMCAR
jgi:1-acyl-sn-glycerol-3-phosphate acyltransferase